jgi:hypothetical protein
MTKKPKEITDAEYAAALTIGRTDAETEIRARRVQYVPERDAIEIVTNRNFGFSIPRVSVHALDDVPTEELAKLELWPDGSVIELGNRDIHISVHGLLTALLPEMLPARAVASAFASRGGQSTSDAKRRSARANGRKGGRPRKHTEADGAPPELTAARTTSELEDILAAETLANPAFKSFLNDHSKLAAALRDFSSTSVIASVAGLLTMPEWQASTLRLEVLQHLVVACAHGTRTPKTADLKSWLAELGAGHAGRLEDPAEDVFVSRVFTPDGNSLIFEGIYEASAFHLQRSLNVLEMMPAEDPYLEIRRAAYGLLRLSNEVARRSNVLAFDVGQTEPVRQVTNKLLGNLDDIRARVTFSRDDLMALGIEMSDLRTFVFDPDNRAAIRDESLGHSTLERRPLFCVGDRLYLVLPTAVSIAIRRMIIEFCVSAGMAGALYASYKDEIAKTFQGMPLLGGTPARQIPFHRHANGIAVANLTRYVDQGRLLHICVIVDDFEGYAESGMNRVNPHDVRTNTVVEASLANVHRDYSFSDDFKEGVSLVVICQWGRPIVLNFEGIRDPRWRLETISAADLAVISWEPSFSPLALWRLIDGRDKLREHNVELFNVNGLLNLYAWSKSLDGHLIPHGQVPDDHDPQIPLGIAIPQNGLLELRRDSALAGNMHVATRWDGRLVKVRREKSSAFFAEDRDEPLYVSLDDFDEGLLVAVFETDARGWWATIEVPNNPDRNLHYRLWHAVTVWLARAAIIIEEMAPSLPDGSIAWICRFEDTNASDTDSPIPTDSEASDLIRTETRQNVVQVVAKRGFIASFRNATNIGERLLVEAFVAGTLRLATNTSVDKKALIDRIVPDEWARDMHLFFAQRFRDFVRSNLPRQSILISKADDAYSKIGLGWRARTRAEGARIVGVDSCCTYLARTVDKVWEEIRNTLKSYRRESLVRRLVANHEAIEAESQQWLRTSRALLSLHDDKTETARVSTHRIAKFNAGSLSTRILIEMALCECPEREGIEAGALDIGRMLANVMQMHHLGGWSESIKYGSKEAEIRVTPFGDIYTNVDFEDRIATPYGQALGTSRFRAGADIYERHFREPEIVESCRGSFNSEFWDAWTEAFGFTIDDMRVFLDNLDDEGLRRKEFIFSGTYADLCSLEKAGRLERKRTRKILDALTLQPRATWASTPPGYAPKDWHPWRFRRRLSVISRPILQLTETDNPRYLIAPGLVREGTMKVIDYCLRGGYDAKDFPRGLMRTWIGAEENRRGHRFNTEVSDRLKSLGWQTRLGIRLTEILNDKLDRDYGDIDVLAWKDGRVLAIECKELELAMTNGEIARQLHEFRGEIRSSNAKPDRLKKHLVRVDLLRQSPTDLKKFLRSSAAVEIETHLVFRGIVPMHFSDIAQRHKVCIETIDDLEAL